MKRMSACLTTTRVDKDGERLPKRALEELVRLTNLSLVPMGGHHDPRIPPQGRVLNARIEELGDGEYAAMAEVEVFEDGDTPAFAPDRTISSRRPESTLEISYDRSFLDPSINADLLAAAASAGIPCSQDLKKSISNLLPVLVFAGIALGYKAMESFVQGFFQGMGASAWKALGSKLTPVLRKARESTSKISETLFLVRIVTPEEAPYVCIELIVPNVTQKEFLKIATDAAPRVDEIASNLKSRYPKIAQFVFSLEDGVIQLLYAVRQDSVPMWPDSPTNPTEVTVNVRGAMEIDVGMGISIAGSFSRVSDSTGC